MNPAWSDSMITDSTTSQPRGWQDEDIPDAPPFVNGTLSQQTDKARFAPGLDREGGVGIPKTQASVPSASAFIRALKGSPETNKSPEAPLPLCNGVYPTNRSPEAPLLMGNGVHPTNREGEDITDTQPSVADFNNLLPVPKGSPGTKGSPAAPIVTRDGIQSVHKEARRLVEERILTAPELRAIMEKVSESVNTLSVLQSVKMLHSQDAEDELRKLVELIEETQQAFGDAIAQYEKMEQAVEDGDIAVERERSRCHQQDIMISFLETAMDSPDLWETYYRLLNHWPRVKGPERAHAWVLKAMISLKNEISQQRRAMEALERLNEMSVQEIAELKHCAPLLLDMKEKMEKEIKELKERQSNAQKSLGGGKDGK